ESRLREPRGLAPFDGTFGSRRLEGIFVEESPLQVAEPSRQNERALTRYTPRGNIIHAVACERAPDIGRMLQSGPGPVMPGAAPKFNSKKTVRSLPAEDGRPPPLPPPSGSEKGTTTLLELPSESEHRAPWMLRAPK